MKTQYYTATSLDGFIASEGDSLDWLFPLGDIYDTSYPAFVVELGAPAMGSATDESMLRHAQTIAAENGPAWPCAQPTWVFTSRTLPAVPGAKLYFARGDVRPVHAVMSAAAGSGNIWVVGTGFAELRYQVPASRAAGAAYPSREPTRIGAALGPLPGVTHHPSIGPGARPTLAAQVERQPSFEQVP